MDATEALRPGSAQELEENGLGLIVHGVGGEDGAGLAAAEEGVEDLVADVAGGLFERLPGSGGAGGNVGVMEVQREVEAGAQISDESSVGVGLRAADPVMDVDDGKADTESGVRRRVGLVKRAKEGDGVRAARDGRAQAVSGVEVASVEKELWDRGHGGNSVGVDPLMSLDLGTYAEDVSRWRDAAGVYGGS